jgi:quinol monooxygenase YgiN
MSFFVRGRFDALPGKRDEFEQIALALAAHAADEPGTLTYRWFSAGEGSYIVIEEYVDEAAAMAHNEARADLIGRVPECADLVSVEVYGPRTLAWAEGNPRVTLHPDFSG